LLVEQLLPHRRPALLVVEFSSQNDCDIAIIGRISGDHPFAREGFASSVIAAELGAQAFGILLGLESGEEGASPRVGYLVSLNEVRFSTPHLPVETNLVVNVRIEARIGDLSLAWFEVLFEGSIAAAGKVGLFVPPDELAQ